MSKITKETSLLPTLEYLPASSVAKTSTVEEQLKQSQALDKVDKTAGYVQAKEEEQMLGFMDEMNQNKARTFEKVKNMAKYNPFVPLGILITVGVLGNGILAMKNNDRVKSQKMMRYRVVAQGSTILALVAGTLLSQFYYSTRE